MFPYLKSAWVLSDQQLGLLAAIVSVTVALAGIPVALVADRTSRVRSVVLMAVIWSVATISCMFASRYPQLLAARAAVGLGEAGYGSIGAALIASHFPARLRATVLAAFFSAASVGSVLGVLLGGQIAVRWGWQSAFGVVGLPGLVIALLYLKVRDYPTAIDDRPSAAEPQSARVSWLRRPHDRSSTDTALGLLWRRRAALAGIERLDLAAELPQSIWRSCSRSSRFTGCLRRAARRTRQPILGTVG